MKRRETFNKHHMMALRKTEVWDDDDEHTLQPWNPALTPTVAK
jgi:hypothetical protein